MNKIYFLILVFLPMAAIAQDIPEPMEPPRMVNDFSLLLNDNNRATLENKLQSFYYQTSTQIYVVILDDIHGYDIADFTFQLGEKWGVGSKDKDNGIVILINPSADRTHGDAFIATGYGLEEFVPDAITNRIVDYDMIPYFKEQRYYDGLDAATTTIIGLTEGEFTADEYIQQHSGSGGPLSVIGFIIFFILMSSFVWGRRSGRGRAVGHNLPLWALLFMASGSRGSHSGGFGNFSSGGGNFGGFGGFGGGGGGSFGGGGAGGSW